MVLWSLAAQLVSDSCGLVCSLSGPLCPLSMESVLALPGLVDTVQCFSRAVNHQVMQAFASLPLPVSDTEIFPPPLGFTD